MAKIKSAFFCQNCGSQFPKWVGKCAECGEWNSLVEERIEASLEKSQKQMSGETKIERLEDGTEKHLIRIKTGIGELDRVLGGGIVPDSFVLLGGDPGIGKSTLLLQIVQALKNSKKILYVSGEESIDQIRTRAHRLGIQGNGNVYLASENVFEAAVASALELKPDILFMDSLQTFSVAGLESAPGSVSQVREVATRLMSLAKTKKMTVFLVGHVTKDGAIAGPRTVEHMVDTVLYFEGDTGLNYRLLRSVKNRFGSSRELGVFEMVGEGLREVPNPSSLFLSERKTKEVGTAITACLEGTRPILIELQGLVSQSNLAMPRRTAVGFDSNRLALLCAILERHLGLKLSQKDLFFNVAGGLKLTEPAADLATAMTIWSSALNQALSHSSVFVGELGLTGEVRSIPQVDLRIDESIRLGFKEIYLPESTPAQTLNPYRQSEKIKIHTVARIRDLGKLLE